MKKFIFCTMLLILSVSLFCQQIPKKTLSHEEYLRKSKSQKAGAWVLLGGGIVVLAITTASSAGVDFQNKKSFPVVPVTIGAAMMVGSVPLFIASARNKRKGMSLSFKNEKAPQIQKSSFVYRSVPSLILKIGM